MPAETRDEAAWGRKVQELAGRGIQLGQLLDFYELLGGEDSIMPCFHPGRSKTSLTNSGTLKFVGTLVNY